MRKVIVAITLVLSVIWGVENRADNIYNTGDTGLAMKGYDPVSYHQLKPVKGNRDITVVYGDVTYSFSSKENLNDFTSNPEKYIPAYGGWCAWAMLDGQKVDVDPERFKVVNDRTYLFYNSFFVDTLKKWNKAAESETEDSLVEKANAKWQTIISQ